MVSQSYNMAAHCNSDLLPEICEALCNGCKPTETKNFEYKLFPIIQDDWLNFDNQLARSSRVSFLNAAVPRVLNMLRSENHKPFNILADGEKIEWKSDKCNNGPKHLPQCGWFYLAYAPRVLRAGIDAKVLVITHNVTFDVNITVTLRHPSENDKASSSGYAIVQPGVLTAIVLKVPRDAPSTGIIKIEGQGEVSRNVNGTGNDILWKFENATKLLWIEGTERVMFIQTDRPIYKPGEAMRMRIVVVDSNLKAVAGRISRISVMNPQKTLVRQWKNVELHNGVAYLKLKFSIKPILGKWKVQAHMGRLSEAIEVKVEKYVLPKFQVTIKPPSYIALGQSKVFADVCAKYSYGKDVNGFMTARVCAVIPGYWRRRWNKPKKVCQAFLKKIFGCVPIEIDLHSFGLFNYSNVWKIKFSIDASVKEMATGLSLNATTVEKPVNRFGIKLSFAGTPDFFKLGLPFEAVLLVTRPDGSRVSNIKVKVAVYFYADSSRNILRKDLIVNNGRAKIDLPEIPVNVYMLIFTAECTRHNVGNGADMIFHTVERWNSPTDSYLGIDKPKKVFKVGEEATINVRYTTVDPYPKSRTVYYTLTCKGFVAHSASFNTEFIGTLSRESNDEVDEIATTVERPTEDPVESPRQKINSATSPTNPTTATPSKSPTTISYDRRKNAATPSPVPKSFTAGSFQVNFNVTQDMSPSCHMLVYYFKLRETVADSRVIDIEGSFANKVSMKFSEEEVFPGANVKLSLKASPGSIFAISAVDKSVHFLGNPNDFSRRRIVDKIKDLDIGPGPEYIDKLRRCKQERTSRLYDKSGFADFEKAFAEGGLIFLTNLIVDVKHCVGQPEGSRDFSSSNEGEELEEDAPAPESGVEKKESVKPEPKKPVRKPPRKQIRSDFRETWLWTEEQFDAKTGEKTINVKVPDTITTWYATGFAISASDGLGVADPVEIKGFKALFVSVNLPYAVTRGELVTIPVVAFNYLSECLNVRISMKDSKEIKSITRDYMNTCICGGRTATVMFKAYARVLGRIQIEAKVESMPKNNCPSFAKFDGSSYTDIVRKKLLVEPEGVEKEYTYNSLVCPKGNEVEDSVKLAIPDKVVDGSVYSELRVIGDLMGPSLANIDGLLKMPYGCGEQNMLNFAPNIFIMQYLQAIGQLTDEIKQKATDYTLQGYQRELTYKHSDGAYSAFGESDKEGSMWLTAFVLKSFAQARDFIEIDSKVLGAAKRWILEKQTSDGCFPSVGSLHNKAMKGGVKSPITLTGYVVVALLEADMRPENPHIRRAISNCIKPDLNKVSDTYSLNILAYTMSKAGYTKELGYLLTKLDILAITENGNRYWGEPKKPEKPRDDWFYAPYTQAKSTDIEQTAYGLMASIEKDKSKAENIDIVRWLSQQRNSLGGWASTQDTVLALQALAVFSAIVHGDKQDLTIDVAVPGISHKFTINNDNKLVLQRLEIPNKFPALLKTYARGKGCALLSASVKYNVKDVQEEPAFMLDVNLSPLLGKKKDAKYGRCHSQEIDICANWLREDSSNMAIISVKMLSGFEPIIETLEKAMSRDKSLKDFEKNGKTYDFYYNRITKKGVCLRFKMKQKQIVQNIQPSLVRVYDYYDTDFKATKMYKLTPAQCGTLNP